jgi:metal-sulfur cluster biosynthetic enzyme
MQSPILNEDELKEWLKPIEDPELFLSLVDLGLIYRCYEIEPEKVKVEMTLTSPGCPAGDYLVNEVKNKMLEYPNVKDVEVEIVWEPKWDPQTMASEEAKEELGLW